jgi:transposase
MIDQDKRQAIYCLHKEGMSLRQIARNMRISVNTVKSIIRQQGMLPEQVRKDKITVDEALLGKVYQDCNGRKQRIHEILTEDHGLDIGYSTLTRLIRELEIGDSKKNQRCSQVPDQPGQEMQHDTTTYTLLINDIRTRVVASIIYWRYSKVRYLKFYRHFDRFTMKCFLHEALMFWGYAARTCIIDNTNLARLRGLGSSAVIVPEMERFAAQYGFEFICHEKDHANRKAGNERSFYTTETNFIPGRTFKTFADLNQQALAWATVRIPNRPLAKTRLIPMNLFADEQVSLTQVPTFITAPYREHRRVTDQYGYVSVGGNYYWVPGTGRHDVTVLEYSDHLKIYHNRRILGEYQLPPEGTKNKKTGPNGQPPPGRQPNNRKKPTAAEEKRLREISSEVSAYIDEFVIPMSGKKRHGFVRQLYRLNQKLTPSLFSATLARAFTYRVTDIDTIQRIAVLKMQQGNCIIQSPDVDMSYKNRKSFLDGQFVDEVDLTTFDDLENSHG